jgi:hypothetical protein
LTASAIIVIIPAPARNAGDIKIEAFRGLLLWQTPNELAAVGPVHTHAPAAQ